jgi:hypothetical protein
MRYRELILWRGRPAGDFVFLAAQKTAGPSCVRTSETPAPRKSARRRFFWSRYFLAGHFAGII